MTESQYIQIDVAAKRRGMEMEQWFSDAITLYWEVTENPASPHYIGDQLERNNYPFAEDEDV